MSKGSFENPYEEYSVATASNVLGSGRSGDQISKKFQAKLNEYKDEKLHILNSRMEKHIFHDETVYTGSAGFALYHLMLPDDRIPTEKLLTALEYINLSKLKGKRISFLCGDAGPLAIAAVISYRLGNQRPDHLPDYNTLVQRLLKLEVLSKSSPDELLYGNSGYLYALFFINKMVDKKDALPPQHIEKVVSTIMKNGKQFAQQMKSESPLLWQWHDKIYFGAAHGMAGILYMLLQAKAYVNVIEIRSFIKPAIDWLLNHRYQSGNFQSSLGSTSGDRLVQWCHGAPGFVPLCLAAYQTFEEDKYLKVALQCGDIVWQRGLCAKGYSICHGVSGNAYAFLQLYQVTKKPIHLYRACCFVEWCVMERPGTEQHSPDRPASLFEGIVGRLFLAEDIKRPLEAKFPAMCL